MQEPISGTSILEAKRKIKLREVRGYFIGTCQWEVIGSYVGSKSSARLSAIDELRAKKQLAFYTLIVAE